MRPRWPGILSANLFDGSGGAVGWFRSIDGDCRMDRAVGSRAAPGSDGLPGDPGADGDNGGDNGGADSGANDGNDSSANGGGSGNNGGTQRRGPGRSDAQRHDVQSDVRKPAGDSDRCRVGNAARVRAVPDVQEAATVQLDANTGST
jgi:hypothetical protein